MRKFLIIDDDDATRILIAEIMNTKASILETNSGIEACHLYKQHCNELDLVLLDIKLPDFDGWELLKRLRAINPLVPCVAVSAIPEAELFRRNKAGEIDAYISKPFDIAEFKKLVSVFLK